MNITKSSAEYLKQYVNEGAKILQYSQFCTYDIEKILNCQISHSSKDLFTPNVSISVDARIDAWKGSGIHFQFQC